MGRFDATRNQYVRSGTGDYGKTYTANGALVITDGVHHLAKTSAGAFTLAAPAAGDEGTEMVITADTAFAHTVTVAGGLGGNAADDVITFAKVGDTITIVASILHWVPKAAPYGAVIS